MEEEAERLYKTKNFTAAFPLAKGACDGGIAAGCNYLGVMYAHGSGVAQDESQAVALYQKACDGGKPAGCTNLGYMCQNGKGIAKDEAQALTFYGKGCDGGYAIGCTALGDIYDQGRGVTIDDVQAAAFYVKGCAGDNAIGCANLGVLYSEGRGGRAGQGTGDEPVSQGLRRRIWARVQVPQGPEPLIGEGTGCTTLVCLRLVCRRAYSTQGFRLGACPAGALHR